MEYEAKYGFTPESDYETMCHEITIPEGFEAHIEGSKVVMKRKEDEDERIRKGLIAMLSQDKDLHHKEIAYLEKQKSKDNEEEYLDGIKRDWFERGKKEVLTVPELYGLEKQKEQKEELVYCLNGLMQDYIKEGKDDEEKEHRLKCYQLFWDALEDTNFFEQKEQKPVESISQLTAKGKGVYKICPRCKEHMVRDDSKVYTSMPPQYGYKCPKCGEVEFDTVIYDSPEMEEQTPAEWSKEDEKTLDCIINVLDRLGYEEFCKSSRDQDIEEERFYYKEIQFLKRLKSLRPQPREEIYQSAKHDLAIRFMNYLDENRPDGKMSLSNGECEDIDKAFKENDWAKILRYVEKYGK